MPIYEYVCDDCGTRYERVVLSRKQQITCPKCSSERRTVQLSVFRTQKSSTSTDQPSSSGPNCGCTPSSCGCH